MADIPAKIVMDFTNTKDSSGFNPKHQPAGDYRGIIKSVEHTISKNENKTPQLVYAIADADMPSAVYRYNCPLTENSAWKIRNLLIAAGIQVPKKKVNIAGPATKIVGQEIGMSLDDDEYEGKMRSQIVGVFPASDLPDEDEAPAKKKAPAKKADTKPADDEDETEDEEDEDLDELDIDDL